VSYLNAIILRRDMRIKGENVPKIAAEPRYMPELGNISRLSPKKRINCKTAYSLAFKYKKLYTTTQRGCGCNERKPFGIDL
jgi:hypothetical protein